MNAEFNVYRILGALGAVLAALNTFFIGLPGDSIPQGVMIGLGAATVAVTALNVFLASPIQVARLAVKHMPLQLKVAQKETEASD